MPRSRIPALVCFVVAILVRPVLAEMTNLGQGGSASLYDGTVAYISNGSIMYWNGKTSSVIAAYGSGPSGGPSLYAGNIAWTSTTPGYGSALNYWDGSTVRQLATSSDYGAIRHASLYNGTIAYMDDTNNFRSDFNIMFWDGSTSRFVGYGYGPPSTWGGQVAYHVGDSNQRVNVWDSNTGAIQDLGPGAVAAIWDGEVVYHGPGGLLLWDGSTTRLISDQATDGPVSFSDGQVAWSYANEMYLWDGAQVDYLGHGTHPSLWNGQIAFYGIRPDGFGDLYFCDDVNELIGKPFGGPPGSGTVPAPGAALLAGIGVALVGWVKRRLA